MNKDLVTVIYYTANQENEAFEKRVQDKLLESIGDLPLISVSRKPMDFGKNICVGEQIRSDSTALRQLLIGLQEAKTEFCIAAESDCLYPPDYFNFIPPTKDNVYRYTNVWILHNWIGPRNKGMFWRKRYSEGAQMCGREFWIKKLEYALKDANGFDGSLVPLVFDTKDKYSWTSENPMVSVKTSEGLRKYTATIKGEEPKAELPYWGKAEDLIKICQK